MRKWVQLIPYLIFLFTVHSFHSFHRYHSLYSYPKYLKYDLKLQDIDPNRRAPTSEIERRRNFAIISHPDAGKTTLTEKLLLFGGAIQDAGAVKARADQRKATSDWMEIEKQRGISVTSTVLSFQYDHGARKYHINLLDTPGHQDFSEDTYRTLAAADNCVMLIDGAKGIEDRTRKLFEVCQMRKLPIFTFVNKLDRPSLTPFELIDQLEKEFKLECCPLNWPIGDGSEFQGVYDRLSKQIHLFKRGDRRKRLSATIIDISDNEIEEIIGKELYTKLMDDIDILDTIMSPPDFTRIKDGSQSLLFFGSAMNNFGIEIFLQRFLQYAQSPMSRTASILSGGGGSGSKDTVITDTDTDSSSRQLPVDPPEDNTPVSSQLQKPSTEQWISPEYPEFTGFVFKLQANLNPKHRDRMAFIRICSGMYEKGMKVNHHRYKNKVLTLSNAQSLFAQDRESIDIAYPGDIIGIHNPGCFAIGDTIYTGNPVISYPGIPSFSPEKFAFLRNLNPAAYKKFHKGLEELLQEGAVQMLAERSDQEDSYGSSTAGLPLLAAVGSLQFDVVLYRLQAEYGVECKLDHLSYIAARWVMNGWEAVARAEKESKLLSLFICQDRWQRPVILFRNPWKIKQLEEEVEYLQLQPWALPPMTT